jgi:hypothetical protein
LGRGGQSKKLRSPKALGLAPKEEKIRPFRASS